MAQSPKEDTEPRVQQLFFGPYRETGMGPQGLASAGLSISISFRAINRMALFFTKNGTAKKILPIKIGLEKDIQKIFEKNLEEILGITFLTSQYPPSNAAIRMDTLGIDHNGSPVIIEYKRTQNETVIPQSISYLRWLLDHRADFEVLVRRLQIAIDIDWDSPRVICVAESYNKFDLDVVYLIPIIELYRFQLYDQGILLVESSTQPKTRKSTAQIFEKNEGRQTKHGFKEKLEHTIEEHFAVAGENTKKLFSALKEKIIALDDTIAEEPKAKYIAYKLTTNFVDIVIYKDSLKIFLNVPSGKLTDPSGLARDLEKPKHVGHWGNGDYQVKLDHIEDVDAVMALVRQSYEYNK